MAETINLYKGKDKNGVESAILTPEVAIYDPSNQARLNTKLKGIQETIETLKGCGGSAWGIELKETESTDWSPLLGNESAWLEYRYQIKRYFLETSTGIAYKLKDDDATKLASTGETIDQSRGEIMTIAPALYYRVDLEKKILWMSSKPLGGHVIETDKVNHLCVYGTYLAYETDGKLHSWSGYKPSASRTITTFWNQAQANNIDLGLIDYDFWKWLMMMGLSEYQSPDSRYRHGLYGFGGTGDTWSVSFSKLTGMTSQLGNIFGKVAAPSDVLAVNSNACSVLVAGIENPYNWYWQMTQGVYFGNSSNANQDGTEIFIYQGNRMPSSTELANHPEGNYRQLTRVTSSSYVKSMILGEEFDIFPKTLSGGQTTYWAVYHWANTTGQLLLWGGLSNAGTASGLGYSHSHHAFSYSSSYFGSRLAFYGTVAGLR